MTFGEMHDLVDVILDKSQTAYFEPSEKDTFLNLAQNELVKNRYKLFEVNEKRREDLLPLVRQFAFVGTSVINLDIVPDFFLILSLKGDFLICGEEQEVALRPRKFDEIYRTSEDPFNRVDDDHPAYVMFNNGVNNIIEIRPTTKVVVANGELTYLKRPLAIDGENNPNSVPELPEHTHEEIVNIASRKMMLTVEAPTYQGQGGETLMQE